MHGKLLNRFLDPFRSDQLEEILAWRIPNFELGGPTSNLPQMCTTSLPFPDLALQLLHPLKDKQILIVTSRDPKAEELILRPTLHRLDSIPLLLDLPNDFLDGFPS